MAIRSELDEFGNALLRHAGKPGVCVRLIAADGEVIAHVTIRSPRGYRIVEDRVEAL